MASGLALALGCCPEKPETLHETARGLREGPRKGGNVMVSVGACGAVVTAIGLCSALFCFLHRCAATPGVLVGLSEWDSGVAEQTGVLLHSSFVCACVSCFAVKSKGIVALAPEAACSEAACSELLFRLWFSAADSALTALSTGSSPRASSTCCAAFFPAHRSRCESCCMQLVV